MAVITVTLTPQEWEAVVEAMHWTLPTLGDQTDIGKSRREHSERCFKAAAEIRHALAE